MTHPTLAATLWPSTPRQSTRLLKPVLLALLGTAALAISAKIQIPFIPVPMTMQTLVVLMLGMAFGWRLGVATVALYLLEGAAGLPVFAGPSTGMAYMAGPTGGYLLGFLLAAAFTGWAAQRGWDRDLPRTAVAMAAGHLIVFIPGVAWLAALIGWDKAWSLGFVMFLPATLLKTALGVALMPLAWKLVRR